MGNSLALNVWKCLGHLQRSNSEIGKTASFTEDAFDIMLSLPDATLAIQGNRAKYLDTMKTCIDISNCLSSNVDTNVDTNTNLVEEESSGSIKLLLKELKCLEEFVSSKVSCRRDKEDELKSIQYFLPFLARISYKVRFTCIGKA